MKHFKRPSLRVIKLVLWAWVMTVVFGTIYATGLHTVRSAANNAQVELAEETVQDLNHGVSVSSVVPEGLAVELRDSLRSYVIVYDKDGKQIAGNARLDGGLSDVPLGVLYHALDAPDHRVTWQPASGVRSAIVVKQWSNAAGSGFVVAGKSLREAEKQETEISLLCWIGWLLTVIPLSLYVWFANDPKAKS